MRAIAALRHTWRSEQSHGPESWLQRTTDSAPTHVYTHTDGHCCGNSTPCKACTAVRKRWDKMEQRPAPLFPKGAHNSRRSPYLNFYRLYVASVFSAVMYVPTPTAVDSKLLWPSRPHHHYVPVGILFRAREYPAADRYAWARVHLYLHSVVTSTSSYPDLTSRVKTVLRQSSNSRMLMPSSGTLLLHEYCNFTHFRCTYIFDTFGPSVLYLKFQ